MKLNYLLLCSLFITACQTKNEYLIEGSLPQPFTGKLYLSYVKDKYTRVDSVTLKNETTFKFKGNIEKPDYYNIATSPWKYEASLIIEPNSQYKIDIKQPHNNTIEIIKGGNEQNILNEFEASISPLEEEIQQLISQFSETQPQDSKAVKDSIEKKMNTNMLLREKTTKDFIKKHPKSFTACHLAGNLLIYTYPELKEIYEIIDTVKYDYSYGYHKFKENLIKSQNSWIQDKPAPDFITHDLEGKEIRLSDFKGNYLLLDFWASWCRPCRQRAAELKAIYDQLQARGITVCGLNMDEEKSKWAKASKEDGIIWTNTGELKPFKENTIAADYKVSQLPTMFLIDPDGKIIMQNPEIEDLMALPLKK